jgi:hypothetical protein
VVMGSHPRRDVSRGTNSLLPVSVAAAEGIAYVEVCDLLRELAERLYPRRSIQLCLLNNCLVQ